MVKVPKLQPLPPLEIRVPIIEDKRSFVKRMAVFFLVLLVLYYSILSFVQSRDNHKLLEQQTDALDRVTRELDQARINQDELIKIVYEQSEQIKKLGGTPANPVVVMVDRDGDGKVDAVATISPQPQPSPTREARPAPSQSPQPKPQPSPTSQPKPSPTPSPTPRPLICVTTPIGEVCTPA